MTKNDVHEVVISDGEIGKVTHQSYKILIRKLEKLSAEVTKIMKGRK